MQSISDGLSVALLVGCLITAVAVAGGQKGFVSSCEGSYKGRELTPDDLTSVLGNHRAWFLEKAPNDPRRANLCQANLGNADLRGAWLPEADLHEANLHGADLREAQLAGADLRRAKLYRADLRGAHLWGRANLQKAMLSEADLQGTTLSTANLQEAWLNEANLQGADLGAANLRGANLNDANFQGARLNNANLEGVALLRANLQEVDLSMTDLFGAIYEPQLGKLPNFWTLTDPHVNNLEMLVFIYSPAALMELREAFKKAGMRTQERQLTYAIEHSKRLHAWDPSWYYPWGEDKRPWLEMLGGKGESLFSYVLFELPSGYGMAPGHALWTLLGLIPIFALPYWLAIKRANHRSGIWMILPEDRLASRSGKKKAVLLRPPMAKTWREHLVGELRMLRTGLYFSLLSAFHLGWREYNVGTWIARLQSREYTLRATGWVRTVAGIQSLLSVYLLALWVLTYFGRPFE